MRKTLFSLSIGRKIVIECKCKFFFLNFIYMRTHSQAICKYKVVSMSADVCACAGDQCTSDLFNFICLELTKNLIVVYRFYVNIIMINYHLR